MSITFRIVPLTDEEAESMVTTSNFNFLHPVTCGDCGATGPFARRIFRILGIKKSKYRDDAVQGAIGYHFQQRYGIHSVFFKTHDNGHYTDSAVCAKCKSTRIVFDIDLTDDFLSVFAKTSGRSLAELRNSIERKAQSIEKHNSSVQP